MFGPLKKLFGKKTDEEPSAPAEVAASPGRPATTVPPTPGPAAPAAAPAATSAPPGTITLPLRSIAARFPETMAALQPQAAVGDVAIPVHRILEQLPRGSVKITLAELRQYAPPNTVPADTHQEQTLIELPLQEILARLDLKTLPRHSAQKQVDVPAEVGDVFGTHGEFVAPEMPVAGKKMPPAAPTTPPAPAQAPEPVTEKPDAKPSAPEPPPAAPVAASQPAVSLPPQPAVPMPSAPISAPGLPKPAPPPQPSISLPSPPAAPIPAPNLPLPSRPAAPAPIPMPAASPSGNTLAVPLSAVCEGWPDDVRQAVEQAGLSEATLELPLQKIEPALRTGHIVFEAQELWTYLNPPPAQPLAGGHHGLELPLKVIAPLFFAQHRPAGTQRKTVQVAESIPTIFSATGEIVPAGAATPQPAAAAPAPAPVAAAWPAVPPPAEPAAPAPAPAIPPPSAPAVTAGAPENVLGEIFGVLEKRSWSPQEVVQHTCKLKGILGALIGMQDGLLVAGQLPPPLQVETVAAFLPQIFGRLNQYGKDLQFGEIRAVTLELAAGRCHIFRANKLFFSALEQRDGEGSSFPELRTIAAELAKQIN